MKPVCNYCTYLTVYKGNRLPLYYIGSSSIDKIKRGYRGSVKSKSYSSIWKSELKNNPHLFKTYILTKHHTRQEATIKENYFHCKLNITKNILYINKSNAVVDGIFGTTCSGEKNPMYGKKRKDAKLRMKNNNPMKDKVVSAKVTKSKSELRAKGLHKSTRNSDKKLKETSNRMKQNNPSLIKICCLDCKKITTFSALIRFHKSCKG